MSTNPLKVTSLENDELKKSLIQFIQAKPEWSDVDYEGSAINTIVDLLVYNSQKASYQANMVANESFLDTAQIRRNVVSHAQKLSYTPKTATAARLECDIEVTPPQGATIQSSIVMEPGTQFIGQSDGDSFTFVNTESYILTYQQTTNTYKAEGVVLFQGQIITETYQHVPETKVNLQNTNADNSTVLVTVDNTAYSKATTIDNLSQDANVYFVGENLYQQTQIEFGRNILGKEPDADSEIKIVYIATEDDHANGLSELIAASPIANYFSITVDVTTQAYGGSGQEDIERMRFLAPKIYQAQDRALTASDYIPLLKQQFPFVRSAIAWGGETNNPPTYGTVFLSILSDNGTLTNSIKRQMISYLSSRNVGSITPIIVDPVHFYAILTVKFSYDSRSTSKSFNDLKSQISVIVSNYNEEINDFDEFLNPSELISRIKRIPGITSVDIDKRVNTKFEVLNFIDPVYEVSFDNPIVPGSLYAFGDIEVSETAIGDTTIGDDKDGNIFVQYTNTQGSVVKENIGTIDYEEGQINFSINMITSGEFSMCIEPVTDNFYVAQNRVIEIDSVDYELLDIKTRDTFTNVGQV